MTKKVTFGAFCEGNLEAEFDTEKEAEEYVSNHTDSWREPLMNWSVWPMIVDIELSEV